MNHEDSPLKDIFIGKMTKAWADNNQIPVVYHPQINSTNLLSKSSDLEDKDFCLYLTDFQTEGKGRGTNQWMSPKGGALLSTWTFFLPNTPNSSFTSRVGLALWRALSSTWSFIPFSLKAPNDIYVHDKKLAGILVETVTQGTEIVAHIGIGLNVLSKPENVSTATALIQCFPKDLALHGQDWIRFVDRFLFEITDAISSCDEELSSTDCENLKLALNHFEGLQETYQKVFPNAELLTLSGKKIPWTQI
ncbi:MAG: biotin--[acetyl-CoA-carboxylase] ligase [Bdellovibrionaceae bacterium]|nr:biotin--[acetyl-CoA-carboxylase] ligase [Pseudobdellovibrionaceae bacterium]NUM59628.1 biotin--[acetyl-CoA-carboxylase] ligase [Pseudobdellovibrionaceae bacterium]